MHRAGCAGDDAVGRQEPLTARDTASSIRRYNLPRIFLLVKNMDTIFGFTPEAADRFGRIAMYWGWGISIAAVFISAASALLLYRSSSVIQAAAAIKIENLRNKNLELEEAVSPRSLEQAVTSHALKQFADVSFLVVSPKDFEPDRTAGQIRWMLEEARWQKYLGPDILYKPFNDGVLVRSWFAPEGERAEAAGYALIEILNKNGIEATKGAPIKELGPNVVYVEVGSKPLPKSLQKNPDDPASPEGFVERGNYAAPWGTQQ
jgi:hypothetical protein